MEAQLVATAPSLTRSKTSSFPRIFFALLLVVQAGHLIEHAVQLTQLYVWGVPKQQAHGVVGALDIEWVHFAWNLMVLGAVILVAYWFRSNPWVMIALVLASWHQIEHTYIIWVYLTTGVPGTPGLLSKGGKILGGLPIPRPVLHALYNVAEVIPLAVGFILAKRQSETEDQASEVASSGRNSIN